MRGRKPGNRCAGKTACDRIWRRADQQWDTGPRDERARGTASRREKQGLGQLRSEQIAASCAKGLAYGQVDAPVPPM